MCICKELCFHLILWGYDRSEQFSCRPGTLSTGEFATSLSCRKLWGVKDRSLYIVFITGEIREAWLTCKPAPRILGGALK